MTQHTPTEPSVISIANYRERAQQGVMTQIEDYWEGLRNGRIMPARSEIDPRGISGALENAFVLERVARGIGRFRLAGMHLNDLMGMEVRGMPLTAMIMPDSRDIVIDTIAAVFDEPASARLTLKSSGGLGRSELDASMLLLPLRSDLGDVSRVLGCFVAEGKIGRAPRRFDVVTHSHRTLIGYADAAATVAAPVASAPKAVDDTAEQRRPVRRGHLTLIKSDD